MSLLLVEAQPCIPANHANTTTEDLLVVAVSVTDADGNPRDGLTNANVNFTLVTGSLTGTVDDFVVAITDGSDKGHTLVQINVSGRP